MKAAFTKRDGLLMETGSTVEEIMNKLRAVGECEEDDFRFLDITNRLASYVDKNGGGSIPIEVTDSIADLRDDDTF